MEIHVPWLEKIETGRSDSQNCLQKDGYGPIFDQSPLVELKRSEVKSIMSDIKLNRKQRIQFLKMSLLWVGGSLLVQ